MKLVSIELHNIGLYQDQAILFQCADKSAQLFWGNNGAGKTTLLTSIKVGLLGQKAVSGDYDKYCEFVSSNLISSRWDKSNGDASIRVSFEMIEGNERKIFALLRRWTFDKDILSEDTSVFCRGEELDFIQSERIQNKIGAILPASLMDVLIFDGENAINLLQKDQMPLLIKNIIYSIFGMDVYAQTIRDLNSCLKRVSLAPTKDTSEDIRALEVGTKYRQLLATNKGLKSILQEALSQRKSKLLSLNASIKRLSQIIGIDFDMVESMKSDVAGLQEAQKILQSELKYVSEEILPLKILEQKIQAIIEKSNAEQPYHVLRTIKALELYFSKDENALASLGALEKKVAAEAEGGTILGLTDAEIYQFNKILAILKEYPKQRLADYLDQKSNTFSSIKEKIGSLDKLSNPEAKKLASSIETISSELDSLNERIYQLEAELKQSDSDLSEIKTIYEEQKKQISITKKNSNSYVQISLYRDSLEEFLESKIAQICFDLDKNIKSELTRIGYRNGSIKQIQIDPKTFNISLFEAGKKLIPFSVFSAGEKQILLGLIIKESLKQSGINGFFLFDTPVGRLDMSNRSIFTNEVIFKVAEQVMVFATDSDYSKSDYMAIKEKITGEKILARNDKDQIVLLPGSIYQGAAA